MQILLLILGIVLCVDAQSLNITVDNTSPLVVYSPTPCFLQISPYCNGEWLLSNTWGAYNGSVTTTEGTDVAHGLTVVPRATLTFQGSSIVFVPGRDSTAAATITIDNLPSILINSSIAAFSGTNLDPARNHSITITFVPSIYPTHLDIDYFLIVQAPPTTFSTSPASTIIAPTNIPTTTPATPPTPTPLPPQNTQPSGIPVGTIAGVATSGSILLLFGLLTCLIATRRRRRRSAYQREKAILFDLRLPSEHPQKERSISRVSRWGEPRSNIPETQQEAREDGAPLSPTDPSQEKGKVREKTWRDSILPPIHYTPWR